MAAAIITTLGLFFLNQLITDSNDLNINLPIIGPFDTVGKTTNNLSLEIQEALSPYIKSPSVNIRILNFRVSVLGEVQNPGTYTVLEERISIPQALGLAGDLTAISL